MGYGAMGISTYYGRGDEEEGIAAMQHAHDLGVTLFDTTKVYGWGENEKIVGWAVEEFLDRIVTPNKFCLTRQLGGNSRLDHILAIVGGEAPVEVA